MPYNERLANQVRELIAACEEQVEEKVMFGGLTFMVNGKICIGIKSNKILVRIDPLLHDKEVQGSGVLPMNHSGKDVPGYLFVDEAEINTYTRLKRWVELALEYNPRAPMAKKKKAPSKSRRS